MPGRERTQMRGWDDDDPVDWEVGSPPPHFARKMPRPVTQRELVNRPFVHDPLQTVRCWCGRPLRDATGMCHLDHVQRT